MDHLKEIWDSYHMELGHPWVLLLMLVPLLIMILPAVKYRSDALYIPFFSEVLAAKGETPSTGTRVARRNWAQTILVWLVWVSLVISAASPQQVGEPQKRIKTSRNMMLSIDLSLSMDTRDWTNAAGELTSRWEAVREVMAEFIEEREGDRMGLVLFGSQAYLQAPFTSDLQLVLDLLDDSEIGLAGAKTVIGNAIGKGIELFNEDSIEERVMVLVTDGYDSGSDIPPLQAARLAARDSITIYTIGIGSVNSGMYELDEPTLKAIAEVTGGRYFRASDRENLREIYTILDELEPIEFEDKDYIPRRLLFYYPLMAAFGLAILYHLLAGLITTIRYLLNRIFQSA